MGVMLGGRGLKWEVGWGEREKEDEGERENKGCVKSGEKVRGEVKWKKGGVS